MPLNKTSNPNVIAAVITAVWCAIAFVLIGRHEIWLDEAQHWLLAKSSGSLSEMYRNMRYEGHPPLWNVLLFLLSRISDSPAIMQYIHLAFAGGTIFLIARNGPFSLWAKLLLPFTFFLGYEYAIIARNYAPAIFFIVLACVWSADVKKNFTRICIALGVAMCFHAYAGGIAVVMLAWFMRQQRSEGTSFRLFLWPLIFFSLFGIVALWFLLRVPTDHFAYAYHGKLFAVEKIGSVLLLPLTSLLHFPQCTVNNWWSTNIFLPESNIAKGIIGLIFWIIPVLVFLKNRPLLVLYVCGTLLLSVGLLVTPTPISIRHAGFVAVLFFVCLWLGGETVWQTKISRSILAVLLTVQVGSWFVTAWKECTQPFSQSKNVAQFISSTYPGMKVAALPLFIGPPVSAYLNQPLFYSEQNTDGTFADWRNGAFEVKPNDFISDCKTYMQQEQLDSMVLVTLMDTNYLHIDFDETKLRARFEGAALMTENYNVYILTRE